MQTKYLHKIFELFSCSESSRRRRSQSIWKILERRQKVSTAIHEVARRVEKVVQPGTEEVCGYRWWRRRGRCSPHTKLHQVVCKRKEKEKKLRTFWYLHLLPTIRVDGGATATAAGFANWQPGCIFTSARVATCPMGRVKRRRRANTSRMPRVILLAFYLWVCVCVWERVPARAFC